MGVDATSLDIGTVGDQFLAVQGPLGSLLPEGLRRGSTVAVTGSMSLALAATAGLAASGLWVAGVGWDRTGLVAAHELGVPWERLVLVSLPEDRKVAVPALAVAVDAFDVVVVCPSRPLGAGDARRLAARVRERRTVLVVVDDPGTERGERSRPGRPVRPAGWWPEAPDVELQVSRGAWKGLGRGHGRLQARWAEVEATGRGRLARPRRLGMWLPGPTGGVGSAETSAAGGLRPHGEHGEHGEVASVEVHPGAAAS